MLGKVARSVGWGVARCFDASRVARPSARASAGAHLLSAPHPAFGHLPRFVEKGSLAFRLDVPELRPQPFRQRLSRRGVVRGRTCGEAATSEPLRAPASKSWTFALCHPRESGGPEAAALKLDPRFRGADSLLLRILHSPIGPESRSLPRRLLGGLLAVALAGCASDSRDVLQQEADFLVKAGMSASTAQSSLASAGFNCGRSYNKTEDCIECD